MIPRRTIRRLAPLPAVLLALLAAGCGGGDEDAGLLSQGRADALLELLDEAEQDFDQGDCDELLATLANLDQEVGSVSGDVDPNLRNTLDTETDELSQLASECEQTETTTTETVEPTTTETVEPTTTEETEPETTTEETEPQPPDDGGEGGGGDDPGDNGGGGGGDGGDDGGGGSGAVPTPGESGEVPPDEGGADSGQGPADESAGRADAAAGSGGGST